MWWLIPVIGLLLGAYFGQFLDIEIPGGMVKYLSIGIMAALDSVLGGARALLERKFDSLLMLSGFFTNALLAAALAYIGDMLGIDLYYAAVFAFGVRLFSNLSLIRIHIIDNLRQREHIFRTFGGMFEDDEEYENEEDDDDGEDGNEDASDGNDGNDDSDGSDDEDAIDGVDNGDESADAGEDAGNNNGADSERTAEDDTTGDADEDAASHREG